MFDQLFGCLQFVQGRKVCQQRSQLMGCEIFLPQLLQAGIDLLMLDSADEVITSNTEEEEIVNADMELFSLALKNLIDNALKYSPDHHVNILVDRGVITISNKGEKLALPIETYFAPFHTSKNGLGLGLYIVKSILDIHQMQLHYDYHDGKNHFLIELP